MTNMFQNSKFNQDISHWNVSEVQDMEGMFKKSLFDKDISNWKPYNLRYSHDIFRNSYTQIPYWVYYEDIDSRIEAIHNFQNKKRLNEELDKKLSIKTINKHTDKKI